MTQQHTKEPWRIGTPPPNGEQTIGDSKGLMVAVATTGYGVSSEDNARRIVACVNACAGIPTEWLESGTVGCLQNVREERDDLLAALRTAVDVTDAAADKLELLEKQRDELLAVLVQIVSFASRNICEHEETYRAGVIWEVCRSCGAKWADDEGGKPKFVEPVEITNALAFIASVKEKA